jgi:hypothetical protein
MLVRVTDGDGKLLGAVSLVLRQEVRHAGRVSYPVVMGRAVTGDDGSASFAGLVDGNFQLQCKRDGYAIENRPLRIRGGKLDPVEIRMTPVRGGTGE